jgi:hypothetical protein
LRFVARKLPLSLQISVDQAICREELRRRFVKAESKLFQVRYEEENDQNERQEFLDSRNFNWTAVSNEEKEQHKEALLGYYPSREREDAFARDKIVKVPGLRLIVIPRLMFDRSDGHEFRIL